MIATSLVNMLTAQPMLILPTTTTPTRRKARRLPASLHLVFVKQPSSFYSHNAHINKIAFPKTKALLVQWIDLEEKKWYLACPCALKSLWYAASFTEYLRTPNVSNREKSVTRETYICTGRSPNRPVNGGPSLLVRNIKLDLFGR